jgi:hypothetical protein
MILYFATMEEIYGPHTCDFYCNQVPPWKENFVCGGCEACNPLSVGLVEHVDFSMSYVQWSLNKLRLANTCPSDTLPLCYNGVANLELRLQILS